MALLQPSPSSSAQHSFFFFLMIPRPPRSTQAHTLFPYTTLFRSPSRTSEWSRVRRGSRPRTLARSEEHTSELQSRELISYAVFCLKKKKRADRFHSLFRRHPNYARHHQSHQLSLSSFFFLRIPRPPRSTQAHTLFPYTTLFRSGRIGEPAGGCGGLARGGGRTGAKLRSEEHTSELQSRELISYAVFCLKKKK